MIDIANVTAWVVAAMFVAAGGAKLFARRRTHYDAQRWGLPIWFLFTLGGIEIFLAVLLVVPATRIPAGILLSVIMVGAIVTQVRIKAWNELLQPIMTLALLAMTVALSV